MRPPKYDGRTADELRGLIHYCPETAAFRWLAGIYRGKPMRIKISPDGYQVLNLWNRWYFAHRIAWAYMVGEWPKYEIDHINFDRADNRFANLRDVPPHINSIHKRALNSAGAVGVKLSGDGKFCARIRIAGKEKWLGTFTTVDAAQAAYANELLRIHPAFAQTIVAVLKRDAVSPPS